MKHYAIIIVLLFVGFSSVSAQLPDQLGEEPTEKELNAPLYPGSLFIRKTENLDKTYLTAMYISLVPIDMVETFFTRKLPEKRIVYYEDKDTHLIVYLLKTWSKFPGKPTKDDLRKLESEACVQLRNYDPGPYESLCKFFEKRSDCLEKASIIRSGQTMILYTYESSDENKGSKQIIGSWNEVSRDLEYYYGSTVEFKGDGTYTFSLSQENIEALAKELYKNKKGEFTSESDLKKYLKERNPEKGRYVLMKNSITMISEKPVDDIPTKSGLYKVANTSLSLELIDKPRLTFLRSSLK